MSQRSPARLEPLEHAPKPAALPLGSSLKSDPSPAELRTSPRIPTVRQRSGSHGEMEPLPKANPNLQPVVSPRLPANSSANSLRSPQGDSLASPSMHPNSLLPGGRPTRDVPRQERSRSSSIASPRDEVPSNDSFTKSGDHHSSGGVTVVDNSSLPPIRTASRSPQRPAL